MYSTKLVEHYPGAFGMMFEGKDGLENSTMDKDRFMVDTNRALKSHPGPINRQTRIEIPIYDKDGNEIGLGEFGWHGPDYDEYGDIECSRLETRQNES